MRHKDSRSCACGAVDHPFVFLSPSQTSGNSVAKLRFSAACPWQRKVLADPIKHRLEQVAVENRLVHANRCDDH
jgi:hypothetical protein